MNFNRLSIVAYGFLMMFASCNPQQSYTNYYFDAENGDDNNVGTSMDQPFKSLSKIKTLSLHGGDSLLLKSGCTFTESLKLSCKGEKDQPVVIGKYGGENRPYIKGNGSDTAAVHLFNSEYVVVRDMEISNSNGTPKAGLLGLWVHLDKYGEAHDIHVDNLMIHDVLGSNVIQDGGGMAICLQNGRDNDSIQSRFNGLTIENCSIKDCQRDGIKFRGYWLRTEWYPNLDVVIKNNTIDGVPGDGIVLAGCDGGLIEYNVMKNCPATLPDSEACDGIWPWCSDNTLVQFNVVSDHKSIVDAYAYDSDWGCKNSVFQYNLSYNNDGGFMLVIGTNGWPDNMCVNGNKETVIRYNVSINDGLRNYYTQSAGKNKRFSPVMHFTGYTENTLTQCNLFYQFPKPDKLIDRTFVQFTEHDSAYGKGDRFIQNYFFASALTIAVKEELSKDNIYENNHYVGPLNTPSAGFTAYKGNFDKSMWYQSNDENWNVLVDFLQDKTISIQGAEIKVLDVLGF